MEDMRRRQERLTGCKVSGEGSKRRRSLVGDGKVNWKVWWQQAGGREQREGMSEKAEGREGRGQRRPRAENRGKTRRVEDRIHLDKGRSLD